MSDRKFKVCIDPGHGTREANQSPDGRYLEYKMTWDLSNRIKDLLLKTGRFEVILTKDNEEETPLLSARAAKANAWGADIYLSTHSNAVGGSGWDESVHGWTVWIYARGGKRERLAQHMLKQCRENGVDLFGSELYTARFAVLARTNMPAVLAENYFHTNQSDVNKLQTDAELDKLAMVQAQGILDYFELGDDIKDLEKPEEEVEVLKDILYRVQTGAFSDEQNAENMAALLEEQGYKTIIKEEKRK